MQFYLGGAMSGLLHNYTKATNWRELMTATLEDAIPGVRCFNPTKHFNFDGETEDLEAMRYDLSALRKSDLLIYNHNAEYSLGSMAEIAIAYERRIPVVTLCLEIPTEKLHPWIKCMSIKVFDDTNALIEYICKHFK